MALKFRTVQREVLAGKETGKIKTYAIAKANGYIGMKDLCELVSARSSMSSADVKAVIDSLNWVMDFVLRIGNIVQLGEFGNFRLSVKSNGTETEKEFNAANIKKARIIFTPGASLRSTQSNVSFEHDKPVEKESDKSNQE